MPLDARRGFLARNWRARRRDTQEEREGGFTLFELIVVVAILPLVVGAIAAALIGVFNNEQQVANSLTSSGDEQVSSSIFIRDVQGATWITNSSLDVCGGTAGTLLLSLSPDDAANTAIQDLVNYIEVANGGSSNTSTILRVTCSAGPGSAVTSTRAIAHGVSAGTSVSAVPSALVINTPPTGWTAASSASSVSLNLSEPTRTGSSTKNSYSVTAGPRTTDTPGQSPPGFNPVPPFMLTGPCPGVNFTGGSGSLNIQNGKGGPGTIATSNSQGQCPSLTSHSPPATFSGGTQIYNYPNPLASLTPPQCTAANPTWTVGCLSGLSPGSCTATKCTSGEYGSSSIGAYIFDSQHGRASVTNAEFDTSLGPDPGLVVFDFPTSASGVTFDGGTPFTKVTYWFQGGLTVAAQSTDTFDPATYIYGINNGSGSALQMGTQATVAIPASSPGMLFYVPPGSSTVSLGSGFSGTLAGALSPYLDTAIWDASSGNLSFGQGNGGGGGLSGGGVYDPNGTVVIAGGYNLQVMFFVVNALSIQTSAVLATG